MKKTIRVPDYFMKPDRKYFVLENDIEAISGIFPIGCNVVIEEYIDDEVRNYKNAYWLVVNRAGRTIKRINELTENDILVGRVVHLFMELEDNHG